MDRAARVSSKGQITVPKSVREALGITEGDEGVFRVHGRHAVLARTPGFLDLAGSVEVPAAKRNVAWDEVIAKTRLVARAESTGIDQVVSFDKAIDRLTTVTRIEP